MQDTGQADGKAFRQMYLTVAQLPTTLLLLTFVLWFMGRDGWDSEPTTTFASVGVLALFGAMALSSLPLAMYVRSLSLRERGELRRSVSRWSTQQETLSGPQAAVARITAAVVVGMALPEISVLLGFVLGFQTQRWDIYIPFAAWSVLGWIVMFPRRSQLQVWYAEQVGQHSALPEMNVVP